MEFFLWHLLCVTWMGGMVSCHGGSLSKRIEISHSRLLSGARSSANATIPPQITTDAMRRIACSNACQQQQQQNNSNCNLWCLSPSAEDSCLLFYMYVVSGYKENKMEDSITCYTQNTRDYAVGASIEGADARPNFPQRVKENLVDGIYDFEDINSCYLGNDRFNPFFKLDLGEKKQITRFWMILQPNDNAAQYYNFEVMVGNEDLPESDFDRYELLGSFPGPSSANQEIVFTRTQPILARYVVVQRMSDVSLCSLDGTTNKNVCMLHICHIHIS